jgi:hypothetical protein
MLTFRYLAFIHVICALILFGSAVLTGLGGFRVASAFMLIFMTLFAVLLGLISWKMYRSALAYLRSPTQRTALVMAANSSVLIWFVLYGIFDAILDQKRIDPLGLIITLLIAWISYRLFLKPAALRTFSNESQTA